MSSKCNDGKKASRFVAQLRTNAPSSSCPEDFMKTFADFLASLLKTDVKNLIIELQTNVTMIRDGSMERAMNIEIHHNSDSINNASKVSIAEQIAKCMTKQLQISQERTLVLFFDTRKCT